MQPAMRVLATAKNYVHSKMETGLCSDRKVSGLSPLLVACWLAVLAWTSPANATMIEFNSTGGTTATNGLHFYIEDTTKIQVRRLDNTGQVYSPGAVPPSNSLDNGIFIRGNGLVYGPSHTVTTFNPTGGMYNTSAITAAVPVNPSVPGVQQTATGTFGITAGPQVSVLWKYTTPLDFLTAEVTLTIPPAYAVSAANPVRYYHVFDTYLGGSDSGCGFTYVDATSGNRFVGTYQPTSGTCTSTTAIPAGINVVESFRERTGLTFTAYCASGWSSFFVNGSTNCSVLQAANMSNALQATFADTGIGIQYSFTTPGTYTFSYDFVIGTPNVPPYDHLEIRHDGASTLCPDTVTVLACTSSTVPCPTLNIVNTGTLTGSVTTSPAAPAVTKTPATFSLGSANSTQGVVLQAAAGGAVTLGTSGLSTTPLNGTKCWNTATSSQSCIMTFSATPCISGYECLETGVTYNNLVTTPAARNPLYTKLSGTDFKFDVLALQSSGAVASTYTAAANVTVELFDDSASPVPACSAYTTPLATQAITFAVGDSGRKTISTNINLANAYSKVRCRVKDTNITPTLYGCSSDDLAVRPQQFTVSSSDANADSAGSSVVGTPKLKAGSTAFTLTANTSTPGYGGTPTLDTTKAAAHTGAVQTGGVTGTFGAAVSATGNGATGAGFKYAEVGYFMLNVAGVVDSTFANIDSASGDCVVGSSSNTPTGGKYGCNIGNAVTPYFGRFTPDHFDTTVAQACNTFTYSAQPFPVYATAMNGSGTPAVTQNYDGTVGAVFSKGVTLSPVGSSGGTAIAGTTGTLGTGATSAASFRKGTNTVAGTVAVTNGSATVTGSGTVFLAQLAVGDVVCVGIKCYAVSAVPSNTSLTLNSSYPGPTASGITLQPGQAFTFTSKQTVPTGVFVRAVDSDGVTSLRSSPVEGGTNVRSGRIRLSNAYGSEVLTTGLPVPTAIEYYDTVTAAGWRLGADTCTVIANSDFSFAFPVNSKNNLSACETAVTVSGTNPSPVVNLTSPGVGNSGWADVTLNLGAVGTGSRCTVVGGAGATATTVNTTGAPWLRFDWKGAGEADPTARATFGVFKSPLIYRRENY